MFEHAPALVYFSQQLLNGLTLGAIYGLIALGYSMVFSILGLINFAHGEIFMIGGYIAFLAVTLFLGFGLSPALVLLLTFTAAIIITSGVGFTLERICYRPLRGAAKLAPFITAIGASIFLQNAVQLWQGSQPKALAQFLNTQYELFPGLVISATQLLILGAGGLLLVLFTLLINKTSFGRQQRAVQQDALMAGLLGIHVNRVISATFMLGAALAAVAGTFVLLYYGVVDFTMGYLAGMKAFAAAVLGGIGSLPGAIVGGLILGLTETFWAGYIGADYKHALGFFVLILVLLLRPQGLFGKPEVEKV
jgi:branched-chain amino acid transport system permease protein